MKHISTKEIKLTISILCSSHYSWAESFYIQSLNFDSKSFEMITDNVNGIVNIKIKDGPGNSHFKIFRSQCNTSELSARQSYYIVPTNILINKIKTNIQWIAEQQVIPIDANYSLLLGSLRKYPLTCYQPGSGYGLGGSGMASGFTKISSLLPPGVYKSPGLQYYFGEIIGDTPSSFAERILSSYKSGDIITINEGSFGDIIIPQSCTPNQNAASIDFGSVKINTSKTGSPIHINIKCNSSESAKNLNINLKSSDGKSSSNMNNTLKNSQLKLTPVQGVDILMNASKSTQVSSDLIVTLTSNISVSSTASPGYVSSVAILQLQFP